MALWDNVQVSKWLIKIHEEGQISYKKVFYIFLKSPNKNKKLGIFGGPTYLQKETYVILLHLPLICAFACVIGFILRIVC